MSPRRSVLVHFVGGALAGALIALLYLGPLPFTWQGTLGVVAAGAAGGVTLGAAAYCFKRMSGVGLYLAAALAGTVGGAMWWFIVRPDSSLGLAAGVGGVSVVFMTFVEMRGVDSGVR